MPTLTSTGAVNLTSSTNWSPAQIPAPGDDLVIGAHTLTLDADMTLNSITLNNASSRLAMSGSTRTVSFTSGITIGGASLTTVLSSALTVGQALTLRGTWFTNAAATLSSIASSTGGNLTLEAIGGAGDILFANSVSGNQRIITNSWSAGTLTTIGRFDLSSWVAGSTIVTMTGGTWNHTNTGTSLLGSGTHQLLIASGAITLNWSGDLVSGCTSSSTLFAASSGVSTFNFLNSSIIKRTGGGSGTNHQAGTWPSIVSIAAGANGTVMNINGILCSSKTSRAISFSLAGSSSSSRVNWRNQSRSISSTDAVVIIASNNHVVDMTDLVLNNAGVFTYIESGSASTVVSAGTLITNTTTSAQASVFSASGALDGKVVNLASTILRIPAAQEVAAGSGNFGYSASPITPTGLVVDPAVIAAAMGTSLENISAAALARFVTVNTGALAASPGSVAKLSQGADIDLTSITSRLPAALIGGKMDCHVGSVASGALNGKGDWTTSASLTPILDALTAVQQSVTNLNNLSAKANIFGSPLLEVPDAGTAVYEYRLVVKDDEDKLVNLDAIPSLTLTSSSGTDRSAYLGAVTNPSTGEYVWQLTIAFNSPKESLLLKATGAKGAELRAAIISCQVVDYDTSTILSQILSRIGVPTTTIAGDISALATSVTEVGVDVDSALSEIALTKAAAISASASASSAAAASATASAQATSTNSIMVSMTETVAGPITRFKASALTQVPNSEGGALQDTLLEVQTKVDGLYEGLYPTDPGTPPTVISPSVGEFVTGYGTVFRDGTQVAGERVNIECVAVATESSGMITVGLTMHEISAVNGVVQFSGLPKGATFYIWTGVGRRSSTARQFTIPIDADGTYEFPSVAGS